VIFLWCSSLVHSISFTTATRTLTLSRRLLFLSSNGINCIIILFLFLVIVHFRYVNNNFLELIYCTTKNRSSTSFFVIFFWCSSLVHSISFATATRTLTLSRRLFLITIIHLLNQLNNTVTNLDLQILNAIETINSRTGSTAKTIASALPENVQNFRWINAVLILLVRSGKVIKKKSLYSLNPTPPVALIVQLQTNANKRKTMASFKKEQKISKKQFKTAKKKGKDEVGNMKNRMFGKYNKNVGRRPRELSAENEMEMTLVGFNAFMKKEDGIQEKRLYQVLLQRQTKILKRRVGLLKHNCVYHYLLTLCSNFVF